MTYTLTLLGTDTQFTPIRVEKAYDRAETLSYVSTLISGATDKKYEVDDVIKYRNEKVAVVDGATTLGPEVGDRIARGVLAVLEAISCGKTDINIIAHSRGAVEGILVAHELEQIQTLLLKDPNYSLRTITSSCTYTKTAMQRRSAAFGKLDHLALARHIGSVKLSMFNIDPVPGGNYLGVTSLSSLAWRDKRFYTVPKIVKEYEQYIYENERTRCFKPIVPKCASPDTVFKLHSLPGHHGTGSGNLLDQQRASSPTKKVTQHVQELVIIKLIDFLTRNGVVIEPKKEGEDPFKDLMNKLYETQESVQQNFQELYFQLYENILENKEAYEHYNKTSYAILGQENGFRKYLWKVIDQRIVHFQAHNDTHLEDIVPPVAMKHFLNYEHARLKLNHELCLNSNNTLPETIKSAISRLLTICVHAKKLEDLKDVKKIKDLSQSVVDDKVAAAMTTQDGFQLLLESLGLLIEDVRNAYLQGRITKDERSKLYDEVKNAFESFKNYTAINSDNSLAQAILRTFNEHLVTMLDTKYKTLKGRYEALSAQLRSKNFFVVLLDQAKQIRNNLKSQGVDRALHDKLDEFVTKAQSLSSTSPIEDIKSHIEQAKASFFDLEEVSSNARNNLLLWMEEALDNCVNYDSENIRGEIVKVCQDFDDFTSDLSTFKELDDKIDCQAWERKLGKERAYMLSLLPNYRIGEQSVHCSANQLKTEQLEKEGLNKELDCVIPTMSKVEAQSVQEKNAGTQKKDGITDKDDLGIKNKVELKCQEIIDQKLLPLTKKYLQYLIKEVDPSVNTNDFDLAKFIKVIQDIQARSLKDNLQKLQVKFEKVSEFYQTLTEQNEVLIPSKKIERFSQQLRDANEEIKMHRDPAWKRYTMNTLAVLAIIATGVLPGLVLLAVNAKMRDKSVEFWASTGHAFFTASEKGVNDASSSISAAKIKPS